jgi:ribosomal protein S18 acetylase RimI-like enzyme
MQDNQQLEIRDTTLDDLLGLRTMHAQSWRDAYESPENGVTKEWIEERVAPWTSSEGIEQSRDHFKDIFGHPDHLHQVAVDANGAIVGFIHVSKNESGQHFEAIYIDKHYYGTGLAQDLMNRALAWSDPSKSMDLDVVSYNERAKAFYKKYKFVEVPGTEDFYAEIIPVITMKREGETV